MSKLTKEEFIRQAEEDFGYERYKELVVELGYGERCLDRYKYEDEVNERFEGKFNEWKSSGFDEKKLFNKKETDENSKPKIVKVAERKEETKEEKVVPIVPEPEKPKVEVVDKETGEVTVEERSEVGETVTNKVYHASDNLSASRIKMVLENAVEFHDVYVSGEAKKKYTDALLVGSLHHTLVLEPEQFNDDYIVLGLDGALKNDLVEAVEKLGGTVERKENGKGDLVVQETMPVLKEKLNELRAKEKRTIVTNKQLELAQKTAVKALESWYVIEANGKTLLKAQLKDVLGLDNSHVERTFYGEIEGVRVQVRPDLLMNLGKTQAIWFCVDLKTAEDATMEMFSKQSARFYYDLQEWVYREVLKQNGINVVDFRFCIAGKSDSSKHAYYQMDKDDIEDAEKIARRAIKKYKFCRDNNIWEESKFDFEKMRFEPCSTVRLPAYRKFQLIDMGVL